MSEIEHLRAEVEGLRRIIARSDAKADMWQIRAEAAEARAAELQGELTEADANAGEWMARLRNVEALPGRWIASTADGLGHRVDHWRGADYAEGFDAGVEACADALRAALAATVNLPGNVIGYLVKVPRQEAIMVHPMDLTIVRAALAAEPAEVTPPAEQRDEADDMCPNCLTPWKCNGPHLAGDPHPMADTPDDDLIEAIARALSPLDGRVRAADARAAYAALVERLGLTEERRCRYVAIESQFAAGLVTERRLVSKWVGVQP